MNSSVIRKDIFKAFLLDPTRFKDPKYALVVLIFLIFIIVVSINQGVTSNIGDFSVFWIAGDNFSHGTSLYTGTGTTRYIYPPFAAIFFQLFALVPFKVATGIFSFVNFILTVFSVSITREIMKFYGYSLKRIHLVLLFSVILFFRYLWYHVTYTQLNVSILVLSLLGVYFMLKKQDIPAAACFVVATFIKVIPVFFIIWLLFRGSLKSYITVIMVTLICIAAPIFWRGMDIGIQDLKDYYVTFLEPFREGRVEASFHNHSLSSAIYNITIGNKQDIHYDYNLFHLSQLVAKKIYFYSFIVLFILFIGCSAYLRFTKKQISMSEVSVILLTSHLLSGITWEYHLVSLLFVFASFFILFLENKSISIKIVDYLILMIIIVNAFVGPDTVGNWAYHYFGGYGALTWMMLLLLFYFLTDCFFGKRGSNFKKQGN